LGAMSAWTARLQNGIDCVNSVSLVEALKSA
jgi:hypothetical protein